MHSFLKPVVIVRSALVIPRPWRSRFVAAFAFLLTALPALANIGGGYAGNGLTGEYFANPDLSGSASFTRRELRLDFDWGTVLPIGGSNDPRYKSVPTDNFSARYTGKIIAAFTETYTFKLVANDGARLFIRPEGGSTWTSLIDQWSTAGTYTATSALVRGTRYEIKVEYRELTGTAALRLLWSSPSTPEEVIDPIMNQGFNVNFWGQCLADLAKCGRNVWDANENGPVTQDTNGWPQNDAAIVLQETLNVGLDVDPLSEGLSTFSFKGRATLGLRGNIKAGDGSDNLSYTYNPATNTTTGTLRITPNGWNASYLLFSDTDRDGQLPARKNGITDLKIMRPSTPGGSVSYPAGTVFNDQARTTGAKFTALRMNLNNANGERRWTDRTTATYFNQSIGKATKNYYTYEGGVDPAPADYNNGPSWEYCVMLANETGADLYLNPPVMADGWTPADTSSYIYKLAQLVRYGSDGVNPYSGPTANPVFPPLNPNLRVYVELSNEVWNPFGAAFRQYFDVSEMMKVDARTALGIPTADDLIDTHARPTDFAILNYDNLSTARNADGNFVSGDTWRKRKVILRSLQVSQIFRAVWGDANMGPRIRPLYEWQYEDANATASIPLKFVDDYFNNGDGTAHVATPRPVNYFFWGGGGASYYGAVNGYGTTDQLIDPSFETPVLNNGYNVAPSGATWTFTGTAGIARDAGTGDDIPPGWEGSAQCGYIAGTGSMTKQITIPSTQISNTYAIVFKAVQRVKAGAPLGTDGKPTPDTQKLRLYVNGVLKEWKSFNQNDGGYKPAAYDPANPWNSFVVFWSPNTPYYSSDIFTAAPGEVVTLRLEGSAAADQIAFVEDVRLASVDSMFADGMPGGGEALGQPAGAGYQTGLNVQASWAFAYGLKYVTYEGGWSLGGDTGGTPMQNTGKFLSTDAAVANTKAINMFHQSGGYLNTFGTYSLWPSWSESIATEGLLNISAYPLIYSQDERMNNLRAEPANGVFIPNSLVIGNASLLPGGTGNVVGRNWLSWNAITTTTDDYTITINTGAGGTAQLWVDGVPLGASFTTGNAVTRTIRLVKGVHGIRLQGIAGNFALQSINFAIPGAPAAPVITTITDGSGTKTVEWGAVAGATGYTIRWGTDSGIYLESADVPIGTSKLLTGLTHDLTYYIVVSAYNATGLSLPSAEVGSTALVDGLSGHLARWDFAGSTGNEVDPAPSSSTSRIITTGLARGPGLRLSGYGLGLTADSFAYQQSSYPGSTTAAGALSRGDYTQFTVTPKPGSTLSVSSLLYAPYWQDSSQTSQGGGIAYSINGGPYILSSVTGTPSSYIGAPLTATLSGIPALQNLTVPVTFRLLHPNVGEYSFAGIGRQSGDDIVLFGSVNTIGVTTGLATFRTATGLAADGSQDTATPAGDGVPNLLKYAFNMIGTGSGQSASLATPNAATLTELGTAGLPFPGADGAGKLQLTYIRRKASSNPGITYTVEFSDALAAWAVNPSATESTTSIDATFERVTVTDSSVAATKRFARMRIVPNRM